MKRLILIAATALMTVSGAGALDGTVAYIEGIVDILPAGGERTEAEIGEVLRTGDTVYTGSDGLAEIELESGSSVTVAASSAFRMSETADPAAETGKKSFFRVLLGAVSFKFRSLSREPDVGTPLAVCSVRGTDFTVIAAPDGSSLTVVSDGLVEVTSGESATLLEPGRGVEVTAGLGLGEPFEAKTGFEMYDDFLTESASRVNEDPIGTLEGLSAMLKQYAEDGEFYLESWETNAEELDRVVDQVVKIRDEKGDDAFETAREELLLPARKRAVELNTTYRYHFISGLSLRRYALSGVYVQMRTRYLSKPDAPEWLRFIEAYDAVLDLYESSLIPFLEYEDL